MKNKLMRILAITLCLLMVLGTVGGAALAASGDAEPAEETAEAVEEAPASTDGTETGDTLYVIAGADGAVEKVIGGEDSDVPVNVTVSYKLDGKAISPEDLAGKSGKVTIRFDYENTQTETVEIDGKREEITVPIAMLSGLVLDNEKFSNVEISSGKLLSDGSRTVAVGLAFPGLKDDLSIDKEKLDDKLGGRLDDRLDLKDYVEVTADARDFSLGMTLTVAASDLFSDFDLDGLDDLDGLQDSLDELTDAMEQLMDGSGQLYDSLETLLEKSGELVSGVDQLATGSASLKTGAAQLDSGVSSLQDGAAQLSAGLNTLSSNSGDLNNGATQVFNTLLSTANSQIAVAGLDAPALTIGNYADVLSGIISSVDSTVYNTALEQVTAAVEAQRGTIRDKVGEAVTAEVEKQVTDAVRSEVEGKVRAAVWEAALPQVIEQVTAAVRAQVEEQVIQTAVGMGKADYDAAVSAGLVDGDTQAAVSAAVATQLGSDEVQATIAAQIEAQKNSETIQAAVAEQTDAQMAGNEVQGLIAATVAEKMAGEDVKGLIEQNTETQVQMIISQQMSGDEVQARMAAAKEEAKPLIGLKASLDSYNAFYLGLQSYTAGVDRLAAGADSLKSGADQLRSGSSQLTAGAGQLNDGITQLQGSVPALVDGVTQLRDGSKELKEGLERFNEEGVQKLVDAVDGDVTGLLNRLRAVKDAADRYTRRAGEDRKVIYRTGSIRE